MRDPFDILGVPAGASALELRQARRKLAKELHPDLDAGRSAAAMAEVNLAYQQALQAAAAVEDEEEARAPAQDAWFSVNVLPVEACEMLIVVGRILGEVLAVDEPYRIESYLEAPEPSFCTLDLVPEAGGTLVTVTVMAADAGMAPDPHAVRDVVVDELIRLTRPATR